MISLFKKSRPGTDLRAPFPAAESYGNRDAWNILARRAVHATRRGASALSRLVLSASLVLCPALAAAEDDGEELLGMMEQPASREAASAFIEDVHRRWDGSLFCIAGTNIDAPETAAAAAFVAVRTYLQEHPEDRSRPRRYLIVQGLRAAFPCPAR